MRALAAVVAVAFAPVVAATSTNRSLPDRQSAIARAQIWSATDIRSKDLVTGPDGPGAFPFRADVKCDFAGRPDGGLSPKFECNAGGDRVKVKFGGTNGEVYGEVAATRLLWALGFGADRMYPVRVICRKCPTTLIARGDTGPGRSVIASSDGELIFDPATIERKMPGKGLPGAVGWSWRELDSAAFDPQGATRAQRDALRLLAVFLQHGDSKPINQRLICRGGWHAESAQPCVDPFLFIQDLGLTFGRANAGNTNSTGGVNLTKWSTTPVWKDQTKCVGNLRASRDGTLDSPIISEEGRRFLAGLLTQLSDGQIHDLFTVARVNLRLRSPNEVSSGYATIDEWVAAFKQKRDEIVDRRCASA
jgi:hypothetical protein